MQTVHTAMSLGDVVKFINSIPSRLAGRATDKIHMAETAKARMAYATIQHLAQAFDDKSRGGYDESGLNWRPNTPRYLAYQKGRPKSMRLKASKRPQSWENGGAGYRTNRRDQLTTENFRYWKVVYKRELAKMSAVMPYVKARAYAANAAWRAVAREGADTLIEKYGRNRADQILVDTGSLRKSLEPGNLVSAGGGSRYVKEGHKQLFKSQKGFFIIGTIDKNGIIHHNGRRAVVGASTRAMRQRRLWNYTWRWPRRWWNEICSQGSSGIVDVLVSHLTETR